MGQLFSIPDFLWTILNLIILYFILKRLLFKPVTEFMEKRADSIKQQLKDAEKSNEDAVTLKQTVEKMMMSAQLDADKVIKEAKMEAQVKYSEIINSARIDAEALKAKAKDEIEQERKEMLKNMRNEIVSLALEAASKIVEANMDTETNRRLVDEVIEKKSIA